MFTFNAIKGHNYIVENLFIPSKVFFEGMKVKSKHTLRIGYGRSDKV